MMRAQIQAESLKNVDQARSLLARDRPSGPRTPPRWSSSPGSSSSGTARRGRSRHRQDPLAMEGGRDQRRARRPARAEARSARPRPSSTSTPRLKKDPDNKIVQYWKAQLDGRTGAVAEATRSLEAIVRNKPVKEVDTGTTLLSAAQSALASLSLRTGDFDDAIRRFEELKRSNQNGTLSQGGPLAVDHGLRRARASGRLPSARSPRSSTTPRTRPPTRSASAAPTSTGSKARMPRPWPSSITCSQVNPTNPAAVVTRSYILLKAKQHDQAARDPAHGDRADEAEGRRSRRRSST